MIMNCNCEHGWQEYEHAWEEWKACEQERESERQESKEYKKELQTCRRGSLQPPSDDREEGRERPFGRRGGTHPSPTRRSLSRRRRKRGNRRTESTEREGEAPGADAKSFKICSVVGGLDVTRYISRDARAFFADAVADVELVREVLSEAATNGGVGRRMTLARLNATLDRRGRGYGDDDPVSTTLEAGQGYIDDHPDRRVDLMVSLLHLGAEATRGTYYNSTRTINAEAELAIVQAAALIFPWIVDRRAKPEFWWVDHQNGRSTGPSKEPFRFDFLYSAAWIGSWGEAWAYYPPLVKLVGKPFSLVDAGGGPNSTGTDRDFIKANLPWNNPTRKTFFTKPYPDLPDAGASIISCLAPVYFTGSIANETFDDTYIASTGLDIHVDSFSKLLDAATKLTSGSFALLVDFDLDIVVISQEVVEKIYPERTGFEDARLLRDMYGNVVDDRRNVTYLVSDTIFQGLMELDNADWDSLRESLEGLQKGQRGYSTLNITLTGDDDAVEFYAMYEKWKYTADFALLVFAPSNEVDNAIHVRFVETTNMAQASPDLSSLALTVRKGASISIHAAILNDGALDVALIPSGTPPWLKFHHSISDTQVLRAGDSLNLNFEVLTDQLKVGTTSSSLSFHIQDNSYPDCFHAEEKSLHITVDVSPGYTSYLIIALSIISGILALYTYVERKKKEADTLWEVKKLELLYDDPPIVLGRGTFGLVLCAEYRGTKVAVKRVIPPPEVASSGDRGNPGGAPCIFDVDADLEKANPRKMYGTGRMSSMGMIPGSLQAAGSTGQTEVGELAPLTGVARRRNVNGHISWSGHFKYARGSSRSTAYLKGDFVQEMRVLSKLRHPCIATFMGAVTARGEEPLLVMECMDRGSLYDILHNPSMIFEGETILSILRDISKGMRFLHSSTPQIIHGDLKAANVLVDSNFCAKVTDFGFSIKQKVGVSGTPYWMAPELLRGAGVNSAASDAYSFGILLYEVFSRRDPYFGEDYESVIRDILDPGINKRPPAPKAMPSEVTSLLYSSCLDSDPAARLDFTELDSFLKIFQVKHVDPRESVLHRQNSRAERLLEEIFPPPVAAALREGRKVEPEHFDCVTIFFSDIVGFTPLSATMPPDKVTNMVDRLCEQMDSLSQKFGVYKLETIGDAWLGVTNLYNACPDDHAKRMALFSMEASQAASECPIDEADPSRGPVQIRIGFHSGPCTGAVVGSRLPKYALFGDTINTAARMESNSEAGRVHCSDRSEELLRVQAPDIPLICRGKINVKGKGEMTTFWVGENPLPPS